MERESLFGGGRGKLHSKMYVLRCRLSAGECFVVVFFLSWVRREGVKIYNSLVVQPYHHSYSYHTRHAIPYHMHHTTILLPPYSYHHTNHNPFFGWLCYCWHIYTIAFYLCVCMFLLRKRRFVVVHSTVIPFWSSTLGVLLFSVVRTTTYSYIHMYGCFQNTREGFNNGQQHVFFFLYVRFSASEFVLLFHYFLNCAINLEQRLRNIAKRFFDQPPSRQMAIIVIVVVL
jgi:hypothetical protein